MKNMGIICIPLGTCPGASDDMGCVCMGINVNGDMRPGDMGPYPVGVMGIPVNNYGASLLP